jgi:trimeric autotransporter adhesin
MKTLFQAVAAMGLPASSSRSRRCAQRTVLGAVTGIVALALSASAQPCTEEWSAGEGIPGVSGRVNASVLWDSDGPGPAQAKLVVGGRFIVAGRSVVSNIAVWNGAVWSPLGTGIGPGDASAEVHCLVAQPNGELIAAGAFAEAGGIAATNIARWNGVSWSPVGTGTNGRIYALAGQPGEGLVAGGSFTAAGGITANHIARWDGTGWSPLGTGMSVKDYGYVYALAASPNGDIIAGGQFSTAGGVPVGRIAKWSAAAGAWESLGAEFTGRVNAVLQLPHGDIVAGGTMRTPGSQIRGIGRRDAATGAWSGIGNGFNGEVSSLGVLPNGELIAAGPLVVWEYDFIRRWTGSNWEQVGSLIGLIGDSSVVRTITVLPGGTFVAAGNFWQADGRMATRVAEWDGSTWHAVGRGTVAEVEAIVAGPDGDMYVGGRIDLSGVHGIARWNEASHSFLPVGTGVEGTVYAMTTLPNGDLVAGGTVESAGGEPVNGIARWNGAEWSAMGSGVGSQIMALATLPNGDVVAGGNFRVINGAPSDRIVRWNGVSWVPMGSGIGSGANGSVSALAVMPNGDVVAGGNFEVVNGLPIDNIARWTWQTGEWTPLGSGTNSTVRAIVVLPNGDLIAGGAFTEAGGVAANHVARWNGTAWQPVGAGTDGVVTELLLRPNGDLVAAGTFLSAGGQPARKIARWDGADWSALSSGVSNGSGGSITALANLAGGVLAVGGDFLLAGGKVALSLTRWGCACYPNCDGSVSPARLSAADFSCFLNNFATGNEYANCDGSQSPPLLNANDFACFMRTYAEGCP